MKQDLARNIYISLKYPDEAPLYKSQPEEAFLAKAGEKHAKKAFKK